MNIKDLKHVILAYPPSYNDYPINLLKVTDLARHALFYPLLADTMKVSFPFLFDFAPFSSYLILHSLDGQGKLIYQGQHYIAGPNTLFFIDCKSDFHLELYKSGYWHFEYLFFNGTLLTTYYNKFHENNYVLCDLSPLSSVASIFAKLLQCKEQKHVDNDFIYSKLITDLLTELIITKANLLDDTSSLPKYILEMKKLFDDHYKEHFNLDDLAQNYHVSKYKIIRDFTIYLHNSPINYLIQKRMEVAKQLLRETDYSVCEIACMVGIDNINHFTNLFKKSTSLTPINYRKSAYGESNILLRN